MPVETIARNGRVTPETLPPADEEEQALRAVASRQLERVRRLKLHVATWAVGVPALGLMWMLTEYFQDNRWPTRFADSDNGIPSTWNPWFFWAAGIWTAVLLLHAIRTYTALRLREPTKADVDREVERLKSRA